MKTQRQLGDLWDNFWVTQEGDLGLGFWALVPVGNGNLDETFPKKILEKGWGKWDFFSQKGRLQGDLSEERGWIWDKEGKDRT